MLALDQFSVRDLARASGVNPTSIRTILGRYPDLTVLVRGDEPQERRRGGQFRTYRVHPDRKEALRKELTEMYRLLPDAPASFTASAPSEDRVALEAFEELIGLCLASATPAKLANLTKRAAGAREIARAEVQSLVVSGRATPDLEKRLQNAETALAALGRNPLREPQGIAKNPTWFRAMPKPVQGIVAAGPFIGNLVPGQLAAAPLGSELEVEQHGQFLIERVNPDAEGVLNQFGLPLRARVLNIEVATDDEGRMVAKVEKPSVSAEVVSSERTVTRRFTIARKPTGFVGTSVSGRSISSVEIRATREGS